MGYKNAWREAAEELGLEYAEHGRLPRLPRLILEREGFPILIEVFHYAGRLDTRALARLSPVSPFRFLLWQRGFFSRLTLGGRADFSDNPAFDRKYKLETDSEEKARIFLSNPRVQAPLLSLNTFRLVLEPARTTELDGVPQAWALAYHQMGTAKTIAEITGLAELFGEGLKTLAAWFQPLGL